MVTSDDIFRRLDGSYSTLWGLIKHGEDAKNILFAPHDNASAWTALPVALIECCTASPVRVFNMEAGSRPVVLTLKKNGSDHSDEIKKLFALRIEMMDGPASDWCYDVKTKKFVRCP